MSLTGRGSVGTATWESAAGEAMPRKMLADCGHAAAGQAFDELRGKRADRVRVVVKCAVADHGTGAVVEVEHRRETEVHAVRAQFGRDHRADRPRGALRGFAVAVPQHAEPAHRRESR